MTATDATAELRVFNMAEIAELLAISPLTARRRCKDGRLPGYKDTDGTWRIRRGDLKAHVDKLAAGVGEGA